MTQENEEDIAQINELGNSLAQTLNAFTRSHEGFHQSQMLLVLVTLVGNFVESIECPDCRKLTAKTIKKILPKTLRDAVAAGRAQEFGGCNNLH
jgi:hypothetical protein